MRIRRLPSWFVLSFCVVEASVVACGGGDNSPSTKTDAGSGSPASTGTMATSGTMSGADSSTSTGASGASGDATVSNDASSGGSGASDSSASGTSGAADGSSGAVLGNDAAASADDGGLAAPLTGLLGTATRPQLTDAQAAQFTIANYFAQTGTLGSLATDNWNPTAGLDVTTFTATYTVGKSGATYATVQAAIDAAVAAGGSKRVYIQIGPGTYDEQVCILASAPPITLYSTSSDATQTIIQHADFQSGVSTMGINPCEPATAGGGMPDANKQAATLDAFNNGFQAKNLTIQNTATNAQLAAVRATLDGGTLHTQAVALATTGDQVILDNVRILSHQDALLVDAPAGTVRRVYAKKAYVAGDVDFIFGAATAVFDQCTIEFVSDRTATTNGQPLAPDTDNRNAYGFLVINSGFTADANTTTGAVSLGRAWDHNCKTTAYYLSNCVATGVYPNGQAAVINSTIDAKYGRTTPWQPAATTGRPYSSTPSACTGGTCPANRLYEYHNTGAGSM